MHEQVGDLFGHPFLHLRAVRQGLHHAGQFAQAQHAAVRQVADVGVAHEREEVVLADAVEGDVADEHDLVIFFGECLAEMHLRVSVQPAEHLGIHAGHAGRRFQQALAIGIFAHRQQNLANGPFDAGMVDGVVGPIGGIGIARRGSSLH